jgi:hypothetical protein
VRFGAGAAIEASFPLAKFVWNSDLTQPPIDSMTLQVETPQTLELRGIPIPSMAEDSGGNCREASVGVSALDTVREVKKARS